MNMMTEEKARRKRWNEYQKRRRWLQKLEKVTGEEAPKICPLAREDNRHPPEYNTIDGIVIERNTAKKCALYNELLNNDCWTTSIPGRCTYSKDYTPCFLFRMWLNQQITGVE